MHGERASTVRLREPTEPERKNLHFVLHDACGCTATAAESGRRGSTRGRAVSRRGWVCPLVARSVWRCEGRLDLVVVSWKFPYPMRPELCEL